MASIGRRLAIAIFALGSGVPLATAHDTEVSLLSASAMKSVVTELADAFWKESGYSLKLAFATVGEVENRVVAGEVADVIIATDLAVERMTAQGLLINQTRAIIARAGIGVGVRQGAAKPDISSTQSFTQALLAAKSVTYADPARGGASGIHFAGIIETLGISQAIREKAILAASPDLVCTAVAKGEVELCVHQISEILPVRGVTLVGPLPTDLQKVTTFAAAVSVRTSMGDAARDFLTFLTHPSLKAKLAKAGLDYPTLPPIALAANDAKFYSERGLVWYAKGDFARAIADFDEAILLDSNNAWALNDRGNAWDDNGDHDRALTDYNHAIGIDRNNAVAFYNRAIMWWRKGLLDRAIPDFDQAVRSSFANATFYNGRGLAWYRRGQYDRAIADFNRAITIDPNFADAYSNRGLAWGGKNDVNRAIADYTKAIDLRPDDAGAYSNRGWAHHSAGRESEALADIGKAIALDARGTTAFIRRAEVYEKLGERDKSIADFATAAEHQLEIAKPALVLKHVTSTAWETR